MPLSSFSYVNRKGWHRYFKTYCIPEDLVPRILSPAYFHHYNAQLMPNDAGIINSSSSQGEKWEKQRAGKPKENEGEQLVLGVGPVQSSFWRLSRLVPLESVRRKLSKYSEKPVDPIEISRVNDFTTDSSVEEMVVEPQSLEIQEGSDGFSLKPFSDIDKGSPDVGTTKNLEGKNNFDRANNRAWRRVPYLPSYVPFGQVLIN